MNRQKQWGHPLLPPYLGRMDPETNPWTCLQRCSSFFANGWKQFKEQLRLGGNGEWWNYLPIAPVWFLVKLTTLPVHLQKLISMHDASSLPSVDCPMRSNGWKEFTSGPLKSPKILWSLAKLGYNTIWFEEIPVCFPCAICPCLGLCIIKIKFKLLKCDQLGSITVCSS